MFVWGHQVSLYGAGGFSIFGCSGLVPFVSVLYVHGNRFRLLGYFDVRYSPYCTLQVNLVQLSLVGSLKIFQSGNSFRVAAKEVVVCLYLWLWVVCILKFMIWSLPPLVISGCRELN